MALIADSAHDRAEQVLLITERLANLIAKETALIEARLPPLEGEAAEEKNRLANAYRLELARIKQDPGLIESAPPALLSQLRQTTAALNAALGGHELALNAVKIVSEGLVQAMAEETVRQRAGEANYNSDGAMARQSGPGPALVDRNA